MAQAVAWSTGVLSSILRLDLGNDERTVNKNTDSALQVTRTLEGRETSMLGKQSVRLQCFYLPSCHQHGEKKTETCKSCFSEQHSYTVYIITAIFHMYPVTDVLCLHCATFSYPFCSYPPDIPKGCVALTSI